MTPGIGHRGVAPLVIGTALVSLVGCGSSASHPAPSTATSAVTSATTTPPSSTASPGSSAAVSSNTPSDDPADWVVDTTVAYDPVVSAPTWVVPSPALPAGISCLPSNNNVAIAFHEGRVFLAWRTAPTHFASAQTKIYVVSSKDMGLTWDLEDEVSLGTDLREPSFISIGGKLVFRYFEAGTNPVAFEPKHIWQTVRTGPGAWSTPTTFGVPGEVPWDVKVRGRRALQTSYVGSHYGTGPSNVELRFQSSTDGMTWTPVSPAGASVYTGGVSETGFELDETGALWGVTRDEDGDATGWGSHVVTAPANDLGAWSFPAKTDPECYESPKMFRHGNDLYLVARRDIGGPMDLGYRALPFDVQKFLYLGLYSCRPKRTALYAIDRAQKRVVPLVDLPSDGDTAFPSIHRLDAHTFLVANYTSPLGNPDRWWIDGQTNPQGTQIYFVTITFKKR